MIKKTLLIIGAGREQIYAYEQAKEMGLSVIGTDMDINAPAFKYADYKLIASTRNVDETLTLALDFNKSIPINGVMTIANDVPLTVATIAERLGLPSISVESAKMVSNKLLMKEVFAQSDIAMPHYKVIKSKDDLFKGVNDMSYPLILKPSDGRGSRGVLYLEKQTNSEWAWENALRYSENKTLLLEEFLNGSQLSVEGIMLDAKYLSIAHADRNYDNLDSTKPFIVENGGIIPSKFKGEILNEIDKLVESAALALGVKRGPVKADIVLTDEGPKIIEIALRLSGNYLATHHIPMAYGVDIVSATIQISLGQKLDPEVLIPKIRKYLGVRYFFPPEGKIKEILGVEGVRDLPYLAYLDIHRNIGDVQEEIISHVARAGTIICEADSYDSAFKRVEDAVNRISFRV